MTELPKRKRLRLQDYDYSSSGMYFVTVCTHENRCLFSNVVGSIHESTASAVSKRGLYDTTDEACFGQSMRRSGDAAETIRCELTAYGKIVETILYMLPLQFENVSVSDAIIMPNHVHMIIDISGIEDFRAIRESPLRTEASGKRSELSKIVGYFKMQVAKRIHGIEPKLQVWQRGYYDHVIRDAADYKTKAEYIATNPLRWLHRKQGESYR